MLGTVFLFLNIGGGEMILIVFAALMLFGGEKLPELARGLGKGIRDFKDASEDVKREINNQINNYEEKKTEPQKSLEEEKLQGYEPVAGTLPAFEGHSATDAIEETELQNPEAPETYEDTQLKHPVTGHYDSPAAEQVTQEKPEQKTTIEQYK
ncbi:twin-arginine translocase TatA/TatE family subunit [Mucilaginibacter sp.]|uniref:Sec-independent protein translocase subunit TatA/TatB n=1 Tax=Mucilaginibacter sp. TaxID=1882438 RepID=UPI0035BBD64D